MGTRVEPDVTRPGAGLITDVEGFGSVCWPDGDECRGGRIRVSGDVY